MLISKEKAIADLIELLGAEKVLTDKAALEGGEGFNRSYEKAFGLRTNPLPMAVVEAKCTDDIVKAMKYCNEQLINVIPRTGCSSGEGLLEVRDPRTIILDGAPMDQIIDIDPYNMMATAQCGVPLHVLEDKVREFGLTTGHSPQSQPVAFMGGLVATRSIGQFSTYYGGIEDMLCGLEAVMPDGRVIRIRPVPRRASGPDMRHLFLGSEGGLAYITEVTVKLFPYYPDYMWMGGYIMKDMATGFKAVRDVMAKGYKPSVVRLYDKPDIDYNFGSVELKDEEAFMFFTVEGPEAVARANGDGIHAIAESYGGQYIGTKAVEHWLEHRNDVCKLIGNPLLHQRYREKNIYYATTEISANWSDIAKIYEDVMANVPGKIDNLVMLGGHVSHSYINGTNIYFVYQLKISAPENFYEEHCKIVDAICEEVLKYPTGGAVHHHGMGKQRVHFSPIEHGSSFSLLEDIKKMMDPNSIMNYGVLVPRYEK
ncbi:MAG: FAD-binding oxidoreductase [Lachnospiraceae bacterium]|nr:FAD-binding oxidoreductase [Lachnospiraceae bacterium]